MDIQSSYQNAMKYAAEKHEAVNQKIPGTDITYVVHLSHVAMEILIANAHSDNFDIDFSIQVALLHDVLEDTPTSYDEVRDKFGDRIAQAVSALTKDENIEDKNLKMQDSLNRIKLQPHEVWAVKLADRITNLQAPPQHWSQEKITDYAAESETIFSELKDANAYLAHRLQNKISHYIMSYIK